MYKTTIIRKAENDLVKVMSLSTFSECILSHTMQDVPLTPPPTAGGLEHDFKEEEEMGPCLNLVVPQSKPSRPDSMLMTITGSIPMFETEELEQETSLLTLPTPPPSPPASEDSEFGEEGTQEDDVPPIVPTTAPPPIPADESPMEPEGQSTEPLPPIPDSLPLLPLPGSEEGEPPQNELPTSRPPPIPILDDSKLHSPDLPSLPPPLLPDSPAAEVSEPSPDNDNNDDGSGRTPHGYIQLEVDLKKRAKGGLGVTVVSSGAPTNDLFMIRRIIAAGAAAKDGRLRPGDRLVAVNGKSLAGLHHAAVLQELNKAPKECHLTVWRDPTAFEVADTTPPSYPTSRRSGSHSSLLTGSDDEQQQLPQQEGLLVTKRSLSISSLENSPLAVAKKLSVGKGLTPRGSPLVHNRLSLSSATAAAAAVGGTPPAMNGTSSSLTKRWSAEAALFAGPAGELMMDDLTPPLPPPPPAPISSSPINPSPGGENSPMVGGQTPELLIHSSGGENGLRNDLMNGDEFDRTESLPIATPPQPPSTPPPPIPSAPPPTLHRGMKLDLTEVAAAMKVAADDLISSSEEEDSGGDEEAPPPLPQTTPPPPAITIVKEEEAPPLAPPPPPQTTPPPTEPKKEAPPPLPQTTPPPPLSTETEKGAESAEIDHSVKEKRIVEVDRPKSLGPVPKGKRLEEAPFEIEVSKGILGGLGLTLCENELGMIAVKALTNRSPITKDGNIK